MLGQLTWEEKSDSCLDFPRGKSLLLIVSDKLNRLLSDSVKYVINEGVHDTHGLLGYTGVWMDLLQHLEDVDPEMLSSLSSPLRFLHRGLNGIDM